MVNPPVYHTSWPRPNQEIRHHHIHQTELSRLRAYVAIQPNRNIKEHDPIRSFKPFHHGASQTYTYLGHIDIL